MVAMKATEKQAKVFAPETLFFSAQNCSSCSLDQLESAAYWLAQIRLAESVGKHWVAAAFFRLAFECQAQVKGTDRGVLLPKDGHQEVADVALQLGKYCIDEPVKSPLIFGDWEVVYCSVPTSPGGLYRTPLGRLIFKTDEMVQVVEAPDVVRNKVSFSVFGLEGAVSLKGKLNVLDSKWIQVIFEAPELKVGSLGFQYGGKSEVKLEITYVDEKIRLGKGSRGSLFVFLR